MSRKILFHFECKVAWMAAYLLAGLMLCICSRWSHAQSDLQKSVIAFELKPSQLSAHPLVRLAAKNANPESKRFAKAERIVGYLSLPSDPKQLQNISVENAIPFDFIVTAEFASKSDRLAALGENELQYLERITKKGKTFYTYPSDNSNLVLIVEDTKLEIGTSNYLSLVERDFATAELAKQFEAVRAGPIRIAADLEGARSFINAALALQAKSGKPPAWVTPFLDVPKKSQAMTLSIDLENEQLLQFQSHSATESEAQYVAKAIKAVIGLAQLGIKEDKKAAPLGLAILSSAHYAADGNVTSLTIKKPENFDDLVSKILAPK